MFRTSRSRFFLFISLSISFLFAVIAQPALAGIVTTDEIVNARQIENTRDRLNALLAREDVRKALAVRGVDVADAQQRVTNMTDAEVQQLAANIDQLPAGGRLSRLEVILLVILLVLLI